MIKINQSNEDMKYFNCRLFSEKVQKVILHTLLIWALRNREIINLSLLGAQISLLCPIFFDSLHF